MIRSILTESQKGLVREMLQNDVPIPVIKDELGLEDADFIYEVVYETSLQNRTFIAGEKFKKSVSFRTEDDQYEKVIKVISRLRKQRGPLKILEQGCGKGWFAGQVAELFSDCKVDAVELTAAGVKFANENYKLPNLNVWQADGRKLEKERVYDVVYHVNVLEHVDNKEEYLSAGIQLLKEDGVLLFSCPTERYWRFWGLPKYLACCLLRKPFIIHAYSDTAIDEFLCSKSNLTIADKSFEGLYLPRRVYYYIPDKLLKRFGRYLEKLEKRLISIGFFSPMMFVFYEVRSEPSSFSSVHASSGLKESVLENSVLTLRKSPFVIMSLLLIWFFSSLIMGLEVLSGRKTFFLQD